MTEKIRHILHVAEDFMYIAVGFVIGGIALALLGSSVINFVTQAMEGNVGEAVLQALDTLLLVVMITEILHTVGISLRDRTLAIEPFIVIGVIAAIRRILVVTAEQASPSAEHMVEFQMAMVELGLLTVMVLALVGAVGMIRKFSLQEVEKH
jgi:uncharacterized membrane protein (DUF373 family)